MKVGRPPIYENDESRKESRRIQNRVTQRKCRLKKKRDKKIELVSLSPWGKDERYRKGLINYFNQYEFNFFFTGTIDPDYIERKRLKIINDEIKQLNQTLETDISYKTEKRVGIQSLRKYTENYIRFLNNRQLITRCFVVFELDKNFKYHVHILLKTNDKVWGFENYSEDHWLMGISLSNPIESEQDKVRKITYCVKQLHPSSRKTRDMNLLDNWFLEGDFEENINHRRGISNSMSTKSIVFYSN